VADFRPASVIAWCDRRLQVLMLTLFDTGCRISEVLGCRWSDCDFDNCLLKVMGKSRKERLVPFSVELRRQPYKLRIDSGQYPEFLFATASGRPLSARNVLRGVKRLCIRLCVEAPERTVHAIRHTFAVEYLRRGGSVFRLQQALGHSSLEMSRRYANLQTADLQAVHRRISLLAGSIPGAASLKPSA